MSSTSGNPRKGGNPQTTNKAAAPVFRAKAKPKVSPVTGANFDFSGDPRIGESFVVVIAGPSGSHSFTFHHPIGKTNLDGDVWVCTPTSEIPDLVARKDDPNEATIRENRERHRFDAAISAKLLVKDAETGVICYPSGAERQPTLAAARAAAKEAAKKLKQKPEPLAYLAHLSADKRVEEDAIRSFLSSEKVVAASEKRFPDSSYTTRSGPLQDREQKAQEYLSGKTRAQAEDEVVKQLFD
jgi:hypothetical protein